MTPDNTPASVAVVPIQREEACPARNRMPCVSQIVAVNPWYACMYCGRSMDD